MVGGQLHFRLQFLGESGGKCEKVGFFYFLWSREVGVYHVSR